MNFWHMQLHPGDREAVNRNEVKKILKEKGVIGLGDQWPNDGGQPQKFQKEIRIGDVVLIRSDGPLALVKIISDCYQNSDNSVWFDLVRNRWKVVYIKKSLISIIRRVGRILYICRKQLK